MWTEKDSSRFQTYKDHLEHIKQHVRKFTSKSHGVSQDPVHGLLRNLRKGIIGGGKDGVLTLTLQHGGQTSGGEGHLKYKHGRSGILLESLN